ncbi:MAG TPA: OmpA family protein [Noviherbaspirillum sp.]
MRRFLIFLFFLVQALAPAAFARSSVPLPASAEPGQVVVSGTVADEASKAAILAKLREVYGADKVVDQLAVGAVVSPPNWSSYVQRLLTPNLKLISRGQLKVDGNSVALNGEVANEVQRQQIASTVATSLNPTYTVNNGLRVVALEQGRIDALLANRTISFESNKAVLTASGRAILDEVVQGLAGLEGRRLEVIGHTDDAGLRERNLALSRERAEVVKRYLADRGIDPDRIAAHGRGPDQPLVSNETAEGRARNRRIEFRIAQ